MSVDPIATRVWEMAEPVAAGEGMEIVDIEFRPEGSRGGRVLRFYLDKEGGANLDDLTRMSRRLSELLDESPEVPGPYTLEVSSPGINRALKKLDHFLRFVGKKVRVRTREMIEGRRSFLGVLKGVAPDKIVVAQEGREYHIAFSLIDKANYEHEWGK
ncbi:MAG TPA: ribosome maturation factor RimP [Candidatus Binatia bacterium]